MPLAAILAFLIRYAIINSIIAIGLGVLTYVGVDELATSIRINISSYLSGMSAEVYMFMAMAGFFKGLGIIMGAINGRIAFMVTKKIGLLF